MIDLRVIKLTYDTPEIRVALTMPGSMVTSRPIPPGGGPGAGGAGEYSVVLREVLERRERERARRREEERRRDQRTISEWLFAGCNCE